MRLLLTYARFVLIGLCLHLGFSWAFVHFVCPKHEAWERDGWFLERDPSVKVLVVGASHAHMAVRAAAMPDTLNIATRGEHLGRTRYRLPWLLDRRPEGIETVLLSFDAATFSDVKTDTYRPEAVWGRYVPYLELAQSRRMPVDYVDMWFRSTLAPYSGEADTLVQFLGRQKAFRRRGGVGIGLLEIQTPAEVAERHFPAPKDLWSETQADAMRAIIADLRGRGIRTVLVSYPVHGSYMHHLEARGVDPERRHALARELVEPGVVDYLDHEDLFLYKRKLFGDPDHLSDIGAALYTRYLTRELRRIGVLPPE